MKKNSFLIKIAKVLIILSIINIVLINTSYFCHCDEDFVSSFSDGFYSNDHGPIHFESEHSSVHIFYNNQPNSEDSQILKICNETINFHFQNFYDLFSSSNNIIPFKKKDVCNLKFIPLYLTNSSLII